MMEISRVTGFQIDLGRSQDYRYEIREKDSYVGDPMCKQRVALTLPGREKTMEGKRWGLDLGLALFSYKIILDTQWEMLCKQWGICE